MAKLTTRIGRAAGRMLDDAETRLLAAEGRRSIAKKVARAKRTTTKALKAGAIAGVVVAATVIVRERRKHRRLDA